MRVQIQAGSARTPTSYGYKDHSDDPAENKVIDRKERGDMERGQYRYFIAANSGKDTGNMESVQT